MGTFFDCHTHTEFSACAEDVTLQGYVEIARTGSQQFAITDHSAQMFYPPDNRWGFWTDDAVALYDANREGGDERIFHYVETIRAAQCGGMLVGIELDVLPDGRKVFPDGLLESLDVIAGAVHSMPTLRHERPVDEVHAEFREQVEALAGHGIEVLVHPYRLILADGVPVSDELLEWTVRIARDAGFALEINSHKQFPDCDVRMVRLALEEGVTIAIGTDTHRTEEFGDFSYHEQILRGAGLAPADRDGRLFHPASGAQEAAAG
ncbi:MAG: PHP domain-containing protein [Armatimonadota bacterium]|jgi:histidinol phosphatase-like PHP family hydrolase